ncbi:MAG: hypothetical protein HYZ75_13035 [Elusimicrobia bacterium]|nr:hypothetical protein [Elusimicrobiota bacterium]
MIERGAVNFAVLLPGKPPRGCKAELEHASLRRETAPAAAPTGWHRAGTCSYVFHVRGRGRSLRCKQFLYDLGPLSALDSAALFDHYAWTITPRPLGGGRLCWLGTDYAKKRAASFYAWGTNVEWRVLEGSFSDDELVALCRGMKPLGVETRPFAALTYWSRHPRYDLNMCAGAYRPPSSLWKLRWPWAAKAHIWSTRPPSARVRSALAPRWRFDSSCRFPGAESQYLFFPSAGTRHQQLWLREFPAKTCPLKEPPPARLPALDSFSGFNAFPITVAEGPLYAASLRLDTGPHDAVWWRGGKTYLLQQSSGTSAGIKSFLEQAQRLSLSARF